jgi:tetratricopeptide (TPR) repeat protein
MFTTSVISKGKVAILAVIFTATLAYTFTTTELYDRGLFRATELLTTTPALFEDNQEALFLLGSSQLQREEHLDGLRYLEMLIRENPTSTRLERSLFAVGRGYHSLGKPERAAANFRALTRLTTDQLTRRQSLFFLGDSLYSAGYHESALLVWDELDLLPKGDSWQLHLARAQSLTALGQLEMATISLRRAEELCPDSSRRGRINYWLGRLLLTSEKYADAAAAYGRSLNEASHGLLTRAAYERGLALFTLREYAESAEQLRDAMGRDGLTEREQLLAHYYYAHASYQAGDYPTAMEQAEAMLATPEWEEEARLLLAWSAYACGNWTVGRDNFARLAEDCSTDENSEECQLRLMAGLCRYRLRDYAEAEADFERLCSSAEEGSAAHYWRAMSVLRQRRHGEALELFLPVAESEGSFADNALYELARRSPEKAIERYTELLQRFPDSELAALAYYERAQTYVRRGEHHLAQLDYRALVDRLPDDELADDALFLLANSAFETERYLEAIPCLEQLIRDYPASEYHDYASLNLADSRYALGEFTEARRLYTLLARSSRITEVSDEAAYGLELCRWRMGEYPDIITATTNYVDARPQSHLAPSLLVMLGKLWQNSGNSSEALSMYRRVLLDSPDSEETAIAAAETAKLYRAMGGNSTVVTELNRLLAELTEGTGRGAVHYQLGEVARRQGEYSLAIGHYNTVIQGFPEHPDWADACYNLAEVYKELRQIDSARAALERLLASDPDPWQRDRANLLRGYIEQLDGREAEALHYHQQVGDSGTDELTVQSLFSQGECHFGIGQYDEALDTFQQVIDSFGTDYSSYTARALLRRGQIYEQRHQPIAARRQYNLLINGDYPNTYKQQAKDRLAGL